jgi:tRNA pseudouridine13 synthase
MLEARVLPAWARGGIVKIKQRPEDFSVVESYRFEEDPKGHYFVYRMDKQKLGTLAAVERLRERFRVKRTDVSFCGLKDKQGRTEQLIAIRDKKIELQDPDLRLTLVGRTKEPLSAKNITSNRFSVIVRDLTEAEAERVPESVAEVSRVGVVNYFDSQRFGFVKHGQGFIAKDLLRGDLQGALKALIAKPSPLDQSEDAKVKQWFADHWGEWELRPPYVSWLKYRPIIQRLRDNSHDFQGALLSIDRRLRAMVVFEFQSALWNDAVRRYLQQKIAARDLIALKYQIGALFFPRAMPPALAKDLHERTFPLLAKDSPLPDPEIRAACEGALAREKLTLEELEITRVEAFHFKHEERPLFVFPGKLHASEARPDEENQGKFKVVLSFTLPPGAYATLVVRRVLWYATPEHSQAEPERMRGNRRPMGRGFKPKEARPDSRYPFATPEQLEALKDSTLVAATPVEATPVKTRKETATPAKAKKDDAKPVPAAVKAAAPVVELPQSKGFLERQRDRKKQRAESRAAPKPAEKAKPTKR